MRMYVSLETVTQYNLKGKKGIGNKYNILYLCDFEV